jgi:hypothetical protein
MSGYVWHSFVGNAEIAIQLSANANKVGLGNLLDSLTEVVFEVDGRATSITHAEQEFNVDTGKIIKIAGYVIYGYENAVLNENGFTIDSQTSSEFDEDKKMYKFEAEISGFTMDFNLSFTKDARSFNFKFEIDSTSSEGGSIIGESQVVISFGEDLSLDGIVGLNAGYEISQWVDSEGNQVAEGSATSITIDVLFKDLLESNDEIVLYAVLNRKFIEVQVNLDNGSATINQEGIEEILIDGILNVSLILDIQTTMLVTPVEGYLLTAINFYDQELNEIVVGYEMTETAEEQYEGSVRQGKAGVSVGVL